MAEERGKTDMERIGLFSELGYISIGDKYITPCSKPFNEAASKKRQMMTGGSKSIANPLDGYFESEFKRVFEGESYSDPVKQRRQQRMEQAKKNVGKTFLPSSGEKKPSGAGSFYGTLGGPIPAFSAELREKKAHTAPRRNFFTNPAKRGTGYGYPNLTLSNDYPYVSEMYDQATQQRKKEFESQKAKLKGGALKLTHYPQEYFDPNPYTTDQPLPPLKETARVKKSLKPFIPSSPAKQAAGMKAGTFNPYPYHSNDPYAIKFQKPTKLEKSFLPPIGPKSYPTRSILAAHVNKSVNPMNYKTVNVMSY